MIFRKITLWSDSSIVLHWINTVPYLLKVFVANRVSEIQDASETAEWRHVRSQDNPADALSRGQLPSDFIKNRLWINGPDWLSKQESCWPDSSIPGLSSDLPETRKNACLLSSITRNAPTEEGKDLEIFEKFSSYKKLKRFVGLVSYLKKGKNFVGKLSVQDLRDAEELIIKRVQEVYFPKEIRELANKGELKRTKQATFLEPFHRWQGFVESGG